MRRIKSACAPRRLDGQFRIPTAMQYRLRERTMRAAIGISAIPRMRTPSRFNFNLGVNLQSTGIPVSRGSYLSPLGQELAPWHLHQVAVASSGLSPQPLLISAAG